MQAKWSIPALQDTGTGNLPVMHEFKLASASTEDLKFSRWLAGLPPWVIPALFAVVLLWPVAAFAQSKYTTGMAVDALWRWMPLLVTKGFGLNILISFFTMAIGTAAGVVLGLWQISPLRSLQRLAWFITQLFRNSPWLVLLYIVMLAFPFEVKLGSLVISIPDWMKAVFGLSLPIMANISEIVRGAIASVPTGQWEAAESLGYSRQQTLWRIILPQCFKRMIPPWMNWYAILTMATPLVSLLGVEEIVTLSRQAMEAEDNHPELLMPFYGFCLVIFFAYCYPIARWTIAMERKFMVKL